MLQSKRILTLYDPGQEVRQRLDYLARLTGLNRSTVLRRLVLDLRLPLEGGDSQPQEKRSKGDTYNEYTT